MNCKWNINGFDIQMVFDFMWSGLRAGFDFNPYHVRHRLFLANLVNIVAADDSVIFKWILVIDGWGISCEIALIWMSLDFTADQSTLVQVMARCRQATSHYLSQCWRRSLSPYGITRPEWVKKHKVHPISHLYRWAMGWIWEKTV